MTTSGRRAVLVTRLRYADGGPGGGLRRNGPNVNFR